jgi:hypothetical protein
MAIQLTVILDTILKQTTEPSSQISPEDKAKLLHNKLCDSDH